MGAGHLHGFSHFAILTVHIDCVEQRLLREGQWDHNSVTAKQSPIWPALG